MSFVDIHHHIIYGLDDGPQTFEESVDMLRAACHDGIGTIIATTHASPGERDFPLEAYRERLKELNDYCQLHTLPLQLLQGAEIFFAESAVRHLQAGRIPTLANSQHILVEFSPDVDYEELFTGLRQLANAGFLPVLAHIERYECLVRKPGLALEIKNDLPVKFQVNCRSLVRRKGMRFRRFLRKVLDARMIDCVATDAHNTDSRKVCMEEGYVALAGCYEQEYADELTWLNQRSILSNSL